MIKVKANGVDFFLLNIFLKLLSLAGCRLLLTSNLKYSLHFPPNFPFNLKLSQFENCIKFGMKLSYECFKDTIMTCLEVTENFGQEVFLVDKDFRQN